MKAQIAKLTQEIQQLKDIDKQRQQRFSTLENRVEELEGGCNLNKDYYSYEDLAKLSGKSERTVRTHEKKGWMRTKFPNAKLRFAKVDVIRYLRGM